MPVIVNRHDFWILTGADPVGLRRLLPLVQVPVCGLQQFRHGPAVFRRSTHSNTNGKRRLFPTFAQCLLHAQRNPICHTRVSVDQHDRELVASIPGG
jgi:hypothetical protein